MIWYIVRDAVILSLVFSLIPLLIAAVPSLIVSFFQASTQVFEPGLVFIVRFLSVALVCLYGWSISWQKLLELWKHALELISRGRL